MNNDRKKACADLESYPDLKKYSILIAEDDLVALDSLARILKRYFKEVYTATSGQDAYSKAINEKIDIILTDMRMPHQDGADFIKQLRDIEINTPIIFMSAYSDSPTLLKVIPLNITEYLLKPIQIDDVLHICEKIIEKREIPLKESNSMKIVYQLPNGIHIDIANKIIMNGNTMIFLTKKEFNLLSLLVKHRHSILDKTQIEYFLWDGEIIAESSVKTLIKKLRTKIGEESIITVKNIGYKISALS